MPISFENITVEHVIDRMKNGEYESHHWIANLLASMHGSSIPEDFRNDLSRRVAITKEALASLTEKPTMRLFRGINDPLDPARPIGEHWSDDPKVAERFGVNVYEYTVIVEQVDWVTTISRRMVWPFEKEVVLSKSPASFCISTQHELV